MLWRIREWMGEALWLILLVLALVAAATVAYFFLPSWVVSADDLAAPVPRAPNAPSPPAPTGADLVAARNGARTGAVALIAALGAAIATGFAARTYYLSRRGQRDDRYASALAGLVPGRTAVCRAAIGTLEQIARTTPLQHQQVMEVLGEFIRGYARPPDASDPPPLLQAACTVLCRRRFRYDGEYVVDLAGADLRGLKFDKANLRGANLRDARLDGAFFRRVDLRKAQLMNAVGRGARFDGASLDDAELSGAQLQYATLDAVQARRTRFEAIGLEQTSFRGADLRQSTGLPRRDTEIVGGLVDTRTRLPGG